MPLDLNRSPDPPELPEPPRGWPYWVASLIAISLFVASAYSVLFVGAADGRPTDIWFLLASALAFEGAFMVDRRNRGRPRTRWQRCRGCLVVVGVVFSLLSLLLARM